MKKSTYFLLSLLWVIASVGLLRGQAGSYGFSTSTNATLVDMTGSTDIFEPIADWRDDIASAVITMPGGFTFPFVGTDFTQFSVNSNGQIQLGATAVPNIATSPAGGRSRIAPISGDNMIQAGGRVHFKLVSGSPRYLVIEFNNLRIPRSFEVGTGSVCQALLYENGNIEFRYGAMFNNNTNPLTRGVYFSNDFTAGTVANVTTINTTPTFDGTSTSALTTSFEAASPMTNLNGTTAGALRSFLFTPPPPCTGTPTAGTVAPALQNVCQGTIPSQLVLSGFSTGVSGITFQWQQSSDNVNFTNVTGGTGATTFNYRPPSFGGTPIYYRCRVTCTNSSAEAFSSSALVSTPAAPTTQVSNVTALFAANLTSANISWTSGNGGRRFVVMNTTNSFTTPVDGPNLPGTPNSNYSGGEQIVYDGTASTATVSGLNCNQEYFVRVYEYRLCTSGGNAYFFNVDPATNNPMPVTTAPTVTQSWAALASGAGPLGIAIDASGNVYTANFSNHTVSKITPAGVVTQSWATLASGAGPLGIAIDASGNVYTTNNGNSTVSKITPEGVVTQSFALASGVATSGIAIDAAGNVYTANRLGNTVSKITPAGVVTQSWAVLASGAGPVGIAIDASGNVYTANANESTVSKITPAGVVTQYWAFLDLDAVPLYMAIDASGNIYTPNSTNNTVSKITPEGVVTRSWAALASGATPFSIAIDASGNVYTANLTNNTISKITPAGVVTQSWATLATGAAPRFIAIDASGDFYTTNNGNSTISKITPPDCPSCPSLSTAPPNVSIVNSTCNSGTVSGGSISAPGGNFTAPGVALPKSLTDIDSPCPDGSVLQYQVNGGSWTTTLPVYNQTGPAQSIKTRCSCTSDPSMNSQESTAVVTVPGVCCTVGAPTIIINNNVCPATTGTITGSGCAGSVLEFALSAAGPWSTTPPTYTTTAFTVFARCRNTTNGCVSTVVSQTTAPVVCCPSFTTAPPNVFIVNSTCNSGTVSGGSISAPASPMYAAPGVALPKSLGGDNSPCPDGSVLQYQVNGGSWTTDLPTYNQTGPAQSIKTRCSCESDPSMNSPESTAVVTAPGTCCPDLSTAPPLATVVNSTCDAMCVASGGSISAPTGTPCPAGSTLQYRVNDGTGIWSTTAPTYAQAGPQQSIQTRCICDSDNTMSSPASIIRLTSPATNCTGTVGAPNIIITNNVCSSTTGTISASGCAGSVLEYALAASGPWSTTPPTYTTTAFTVFARCRNTTNGCVSTVVSQTTAPVVCCPSFTSAPPNVSIVNSSCGSGCTLTGGSITAPTGTPCPAGSTLQYQVNGGSWTTSVPNYNQSSPVLNIRTRCACDNDANIVSAESTPVTTVPGTLSNPVVPANGASTVACLALATPPTPPVVTACNGSAITPTGPTVINSPSQNGFTPSPFTCEGTRTYIWTYSCGSTFATWSYVYTIEREPFTVPANGGATVNNPALATQPTPPVVMSNCGEPLTPTGPAVTNDPNPIVCTGTRTYAWTYTDCEGNTAVWSFVYTIIDNTPPMVSCSNSSVTFNGQEDIALNANALATATDNCGIQSITLNPSSITCQQVGQTVPVTVTVRDLSNNTATCTSNITVGGLPCGWSQNADGVGCTGGNSIAFNPATAVWTATSTNCYYAPPFSSDSHAFAQRQLCGNGSITVRIDNVNGQGWAGIVMRETNAPGAKKAQLMTNLSSFIRREFRSITGAQAYPQQIPSINHRWLRITRTGNQFQMFTSLNGTTWQFAGAQTIVMANCIQVGLMLTNFSANSTVSATFSQLVVDGSNVPLGLPGNGVAELAPYLSPLTPDFSVFPNPTSGELNLDLTQYIGRSVRIELYGIEGKLLQFSELDEVQTTLERLDLKGFQNGMYLVKVKSAGLPDAIRRVVKQN